MINAGPILYTNRMATALPPAVAAAVRRAAAAQGVPVAEFVRRAIAAQLVAEGVVQAPANLSLNTRSIR